MYAPRQFREERRETLLAALRAIRFCSLVTSGENGLEAAHLPMVARESAGGLVLEGHVALANPFWKNAVAARAALAVFQGPQAYVHPGWYETKRVTGKAVPTWNYVMIEARGVLSVEREPDVLLAHLRDLTTQNEDGQAEPWALSDAPADYIDALVRGIVGLRFKVEQLEGVWKMNQNHPEANRQGVIAGLEASGRPGDREMAEAMRRCESVRNV